MVSLLRKLGSSTAALPASSLYELSARSLDGAQEIPLSNYTGNVSLVVNVASK